MFKKISESATGLKKTRVLCASAVLAALYVALYAVKLQLTPQLRVTFTFIPLAVSGWLFGALPAMLVGTVGDVAGALLFPSGAYFPGFTVTAMLTGLIYGICLYHKEGIKATITVVWSKLLVNVLMHVALNSFWLAVITGKGFAFYAAGRLVKNIILLPIEVIILIAVMEFLSSHGIEKMYKSNINGR